jgi:curved DNA-binding protein CbpA
LDSRGYYAILEVSERATFLEIKRSYRRLARKYHPDRNGNSRSEENIKRINQAYEILSDKDKRRVYDSDALVNEKIRDPGNETTNDLINQSSHRAKEQAEAFSPSNKLRRTHSTIPNPSISMLDVPRSRFHIIIDPSLCLAFGGCETISPRVFTVDKKKRINPKAKVLSETADSLERIVLAAQACPTKAISIIDRYTGDQIYP